MQRHHFRFYELLRAAIAMLATLFALVCLCQVNKAMAVEAAGKITDEQLLSYIGRDPLPPGTIGWQLLRQVKLVEAKQKGAKAAAMRPEFSPQIKELDNKVVKVYGFVLPLSTSQKQSHFLISPLPSHCPFCVNQGPDSMIEVVAKNPVDYSPWEPIIMRGKLTLVNDEYLFYRLTNAETVK